MKLETYLQKLRNLLDKFKTIDDLIVFGSTVKGSSEPKDLDVALMLKNAEEASKIKDEIREIAKDADIEIINSIYNPLWTVLIREGFSIRRNQYLFEIYKIEPVVLYRYSLKTLNPVQKVQFTRGLKAVLKDTKAKILSRSVVLVPMGKKAGFDEFLSTWNLTYETNSFELFPILRKGEIA